MQGLARWFNGLGSADRGLVTFLLGVILTSGLVGLVALGIIVSSVSPAETPSGLPTVALAESPLPQAGALTPSPLPGSLAEAATRGARSTVVIAVALGYRGMASGSGVVLENGQVLTNAHVVQGAIRVGVFTPDAHGREAQILGVDTQRDVALLQVTDVQGLIPATLGDSSRLEVLEEVAAVGYPLLDRFDDLVPSTTRGTISKVSTTVRGLTFIQHEATINHGNSGGPLLNQRGEVVGINTASMKDASGMYLAIPINEVKTRLGSLVSGPRPRSAAAAPPSERSRPEEAISRYYALVSARDYARAYDSFSTDYQRRAPYAAFADSLATKRNAWVQRTEAQPQGSNGSIVYSEVLSTDVARGQLVTAAYRERWRIVWDRDAWRIDDLLDAQAIPTVTPPPTATPWPTLTPRPTLTPWPTATPYVPAPYQQPSYVPAPTGGPYRASPTAVPTVRVQASSAPSPTVTRLPATAARPTVRPMVAPTATPAPRCQSLPSPVVAGHYFDVVAVSAPIVQGGEVRVEGVVRNNCDRAFSGVVRVQGFSTPGQVIADEQQHVGVVGPDGRARFSVSLGRVPGIARVLAVADRE
jgi:S1-C subfamily serine protease